MSIPDDYKVDHLFLLIGRNPLPSYISATLLLKPGGSLYLVHSQGPQGTGDVAQRLAAYFRDYPLQFVPVRLKDNVALRRQIESYLQQIGQGIIGLDYTGGTKVMAILSYQSVQKFGIGHKINPIYSYLDADTHELVIDSELGHRAFRRKVLEEVEISLQTVLDLHGVRVLGRLQTEPQFEKLAGALAQMHGTVDGIKAWQKSLRKRFRFRGWEGHLWQEMKKELLAEGVTKEVVDELAYVLKLSDGQPVNLRKAARNADMKSVRELEIWFQGAWLENWALTCVKELGYEHRARELRGRLSSGRFEIDVAVMRGYQLFALTCSVTTSSVRAKQKLFEIYVRARQIGGDEACVGLICPVEDHQRLQLEIAQSVGSANRVRVFGRRHISDLKTHLKQWFKSV